MHYEYTCSVCESRSRIADEKHVATMWLLLIIGVVFMAGIVAIFCDMGSSIAERIGAASVPAAYVAFIAYACPRELREHYQAKKTA